MPQRRNARQTPSVWISQNFLTGSDAIRRILDRAGLCGTDRVIEIGPGKGHITRALLGRCCSVTAVEIDGRLFSRLRAGFSGEDRLRLIHDDFLRRNLPAQGEYKVFSNIPFSRTTAILRKLTECSNPPADAWLVVEKGASLRFEGKPHETSASLLLKPFFDLRTVYYFRKEDFHPKPSVDCVLLHLHRKEHPDLALPLRGKYAFFLSKALAARSRNASGLRAVFTKRQLSTALRIAGVRDADARGGAGSSSILYSQWLRLFECYCRYRG